MSGKPVDRTGQKFGRLTLVEYAGNKRWKCLCDCGNEVIVETHSLTRGHTKSCGCLYRDTRAMNLKNRIGMRFGRLVVTEYVGNAFWKCKCDCGNEIVVKGAQLDNGHTKSCGCYHRDQVSKAATTHGASGERLYSVWQGMKSRCYDSSRYNYKNYGGRGIKMCDEWRNDFTAFKVWAIANGYNPEAPKGTCTIDRIDVNGNYEPSNCRWVDMVVQSTNQRKRKSTPRMCKAVEQIDADGNVIARYPSIKEASNITGINADGISAVCHGHYKTTHGTIWRLAS